jgi:hypothetical protein
LADKSDKPPTSDLATSTPKTPKKATTFPPDRWSGSVVSKTRPPPTMPSASELDAGATQADTGQPAPPTEQEARDFLNVRFRAAGYELASDYQFHAPGVAVVLDAFDADKRCGYVYVSHNDVDIVSDIGHGEELAFKQMFDTGDAFILVIHDRDIDQLSTLEHRLDDFLGAVHRRLQQP